MITGRGWPELSIPGNQHQKKKKGKHKLFGIRRKLFLLSSLTTMARRSFRTHIQALEDAKQGAGCLLERNDTRYLEGTTLAGTSASTFISALPPAPQPLFLQQPSITPKPEPVPMPEPVSIKGDDLPAKKKTQVSTLHWNHKLALPLT